MRIKPRQKKRKTKMDTIHNIARGVCIQDGSVLLAYFKEDKHYFLPGGHIEIGESALETLRREFMEELKLKVEPTKFIAVLEHLWTNKHSTQHEINFIFSVEAPSAQNIQSQRPHLEFRWVPLKELNNINFLPKEMLQTIEGGPVHKRSSSFMTTFDTSLMRFSEHNE